MSYLCLSVFYCYKQDAVLSYIAVSIQAMSVVVDGINMNRRSIGGGGGGGTIYEIRGRRMDCSCFYVH